MHMPRHWLRSLWVLGPVIFLGGSRLHIHALAVGGALGTVIGLFYGYWPRSRKRRARADLPAVPSARSR